MPGGHPLHPPQSEVHHVMVTRDPLNMVLNTKKFTATLHIWRPSPPSTTSGHAM